MSTTVTYNNVTSTPFSKTTKYLNTAGKWVEQDIRVTDTGMSEDDSLYQDMNGFITVSDDYSTATHTESLTITENGTYNAPTNTAYSSVKVAVPCDSFIESVIDKSVTEVTAEDLEGVEKIGDYAFYGCTNLESVELPDEITTIGSYVFCNCSNATNINLTNITTIGQQSFNGVTCNLVFPKLTTTTNTVNTLSTFKGYKVDFGKDFYSMNNWTFNGMNDTTPMDTVILRRSISAVTLTGISGWGGKFTNGTGGTLYVPQALIETYQSATNWSTILGYENNQILPIEGSQYEYYYANGTPIE